MTDPATETPWALYKRLRAEGLSMDETVPRLRQTGLSAEDIADLLKDEDGAPKRPQPRNEGSDHAPFNPIARLAFEALPDRDEKPFDPSMDDGSVKSAARGAALAMAAVGVILPVVMAAILTKNMELGVLLFIGAVFGVPLLLLGLFQALTLRPWPGVLAGTALMALPIGFVKVNQSLLGLIAIVLSIAPVTCTYQLIAARRDRARSAPGA